MNSLLNSYDPSNPASLDSALTGAGLADSYYQQGVLGTGPADPGAEGPTTAAPASIPVSASNATSTSNSSGGLNVYQQSLASLQAWTDTTLITSALGGTPSSSDDGDDASSLTAALESAAQTQASTQQAQQQAALAAAQSAISAGTNVDTSA